MRPFRTVFLPFVAALNLPACASDGTAPNMDAGIAASEKLAELRQSALQLERLMPGAQVEKLLGPPTTSETTTCGRSAGQSWPCTLWRYETTTGTRDLQPVLAVYLRCEMIRKLDLVRALHRRGLVTDDDLAAFRNDPRAAGRVELCVVNSWRWL